MTIYPFGMSASELSEIVARDSGIQGGVAVFRGDRVPVQSLFDHLEAGESIDEFLDGFRTVAREQVIRLLEIYRAETLTAV